MKALKPSHRENKRYLLIKGKDANKKTIEKTILEFVGVLGYANASPEFIKNDILAINRKSLNNVRASFVSSNKNIDIVKVSGSLKQLKN